MTDPSEIELRALGYYAPTGFRCTREEQEDFLARDAVRHQAEDISRTYLAYLDGIEVGYITLTMDAVLLAKPEKPAGIPFPRLPAVKLAQMAVDKNWEGRGIGKQLVALAAMEALSVRARLGCRYLTLDAATEWLVGWYSQLEFKVNKLDQREREKRARERGIDVAQLATSMRLDLHHLLVDLQDRYPRDFPRDE